MFIYLSFRTPGLLKEFIADLHSGKLHREFHHGPDPTETPQIGEQGVRITGVVNFADSSCSEVLLLRPPLKLSGLIEKCRLLDNDW